MCVFCISAVKRVDCAIRIRLNYYSLITNLSCVPFQVSLLAPQREKRSVATVGNFIIDCKAGGIIRLVASVHLSVRLCETYVVHP